MPNLILVTQELGWAGHIAKTLEPLNISILVLEYAAALSSATSELEPALAVLDGRLEPSQIEQLAAELGPRCELVVLHATEPPQVSSACFSWVRWPGDEARLVSLVQRRLSVSLPPPAFNVSEYIQLACIARRSVSIACSTGRAIGHILVSGGDVWDAGAVSASGNSRVHGETAFRFWVTQPEVWIRVHALHSLPKERAILAHWEHLLLETMQLQDEGSLNNTVEWLSASQPSPVLDDHRHERASVPPPSSLTYPERARLLVNQAIRAITECNYELAAQALESALELAPDDKLVAHRLMKLREIIG